MSIAEDEVPFVLHTEGDVALFKPMLLWVSVRQPNYPHN